MPEIIDPSVGKLNPNLYQAARLSGLNSESSKQLNQMAKQYELGKKLIALGDIKGREEFLKLDPTIKINLQGLFTDREMFNDEPSYLQQVKKLFGEGLLFPLKVVTSPIMKAIDALVAWEKTVKTPYPTARQYGEAKEAKKLNLPITKRVDFKVGVLSDTYDGKNNWQWEKIAGYEERYGVALTTLARANAEGRTVEGAIDLYGNADEEMMQAIIFMYDKPKKFETLRDAIKVDAQISPGRDFVNDVLMSGKPIDSDYWPNKVLKLLGMDLTTRKGQTKAKEFVSGQIDGFYTIFGDPLTYIGLGIPAIAKLTARGVSGITVGLGQAIKMSAFKTKGQRLAEQFKFVSERQGIETGYAWLFKEPEVKKLWDDQLGPRLEKFKEANTAIEKSSVLESIRFDFPEWYNESMIKTLTNSMETFDAAGAQKFFTHVDDSYSMLNGRVNGISFRRNGIPYARGSRLVTSATHRIAYSIFNPSSELDRVSKEVLEKTQGDLARGWAQITKVADDENKLLNTEIEDIFEIQKDIKGARALAYKLGVAATRLPGPVFTGPDSYLTADNIRNTANLVFPKNIANPVTLMLLDEPIDVQLTVMRNMQYAYMKRVGLEETDILQILKQTYNGEAAFTAAPDLPIGNQFLTQMHPLAVNIVNGQGTLAASGAIEPSQLKKGIRQLPFDTIYQLSATSRLDKLPKGTPAKKLILALNGIARSTFAARYNNFWSAYTLFPRLGVRTNVDEMFFYYLTKPINDIGNFVATKFQKDIKGITAVTGSSGAIGPVKGTAYYVANKLGVKVNGKPFDPRMTLTAPERAQLSEDIRAGISKEVGYEVPLSEVSQLVIKDTILSRIEDILKIDGPSWENTKRLFRHNSNFSDGLITSMGARDLVVGKLDRDFFDASFSIDQLTLFIKEMGLSKKSEYSPRAIKDLNDFELGVTMWDNFLLRFGFNQVKVLEGQYINPVDVFYNNNGLKTNLDFAKARTDLMEQMGASYNEVTGMYDILDPKVLQTTLSNFSESVYFRQKGLSNPEMARIYSERMLTDMRFSFHGSAEGFNETLYNLLITKHKEVIKAGSRQNKPASLAWSRAATNLNWQEFNASTLGMRPTSGFINTRIESSGKNVDLDGLKENIGFFATMFEKYPDKALELMDRQVTGFFRLPAMKVAIDKGFNDIKPFELNLANRHYKAIMDENPSMDPKLARERAEFLAEKTATNVVVNMATDSVLEFVDNPNIRSNFAMSIRFLGRFVRATEDFQRRVYRLYSNESARALFRMRLLNYGLENFGAVYEDEKGDEYLVLPTDIIMNSATEKLIRIATGDDNYRVGTYNEFTLKFRLTNPSFAPDAGVPAFAGPVAGISIILAKAMLRDLPVISSVLPDNWEDEIYPFANKVADYLDKFAMGHIGRNTDVGEIMRVSVPMLFSTIIDAASSTENSRSKANNFFQAASYLEAFGNGLPDDADATVKAQYFRHLKIAAGNVAVGQVILGMTGSPVFPTLKDSKGLPDFIRDTGVSTWTGAFWDIYNGVLRSDTEISNPMEYALAAFIGSNPGKAVYTIPRNEKSTRVFINKTNELKDWAITNKQFVDTFSKSGIGYIFGPKVGEYNPDIYNWMESHDLVKQPELLDYLEKVQIAVDKEKYFAIGKALNKKLFAESDYTERSRLISKAETERRLITISNPALEAALLETDSKGELNQMLADLRAATNSKIAPMSKETRLAMQLAVDQVSSFIEFSDNSYNKSLYTFSNDRDRFKEEVKAILQQLTFDPAVKEATRLVFVPLLNKYSRDALTASVERG